MTKRGPYPAVCFALTAILAAPAAAGSDSEVSITLSRALFCKPGRDQQPPDDIVFNLARIDGRWEPMLLGFPSRQKRWVQSGRLLEAHRTDDGLTLRSLFSVNMDGWPAGGLAWYTVRLKRAGGQYEGTYEGTYRGQPVSGAARGRDVPVAPRIDGHVPCAPEEHPRLVFRRAHIEEMRRRAATPVGQAVMARLRRLLDEPGGFSPAELAAGSGLLYVLTGDFAHASRARQHLWTMLRRDGQLSNRPADVLSAALAYDLCYDAWDTPWRWRMIRELRARARGPMPVHSGDGVWAEPWSNWCGAARGAAGAAALAVLGDGGDPAAELGPAEPRAIAPPPAFRPGRGVPACPVSAGAMPARWLFAGPFPAHEDEPFTPADQEPRRPALHAIGGFESAAPELGTRVPFGDTTFTFGRIPPDALVQNTHMGELALNVSPLAGETGASVIYLYTVLHNDAPRTVRAHSGARTGVRMWVAGQAVAVGDLLKLAPGHYPFLVEVAVPPGRPPSSLLVCPRLAEMPPGELEEYLEQLRTTRLNKSELPPRNVRFAALLVPHYLAAAMGPTGDCIEGASAGAYALTEGVLPFALAYRNVVGRDLPATTAGGDVLLRLWITGLTGIRQAEDKAGGSKAIVPAMPAWGLREPAADYGRLFARGMFVASPRDLPAAMWTFERFWGPAGSGTLGVLRPQDAIYALANITPDVRPANPAGSLPRVLTDPVTGLHIFRNAWKDESDVVVAVHLRSAPPHAAGVHGEAGSFRISAFGCELASAGPSADRSAQNVVLAGSAAARGAARRTHFETWEDGSAVLTLDMDGVYGAQASSSSPGHLRAIAVDYSALSGAQAVVCIVDSLAAPGPRTWQMHTAGRAAVQGRTFTIATPAGATMTGTFIAPADATPELHGTTGGPIRAAGAGHFMVVMTIQRDHPPPVRVAGDGPNTTVSVGRQMISFDGRRITMRRP